MQDSKPGVNFVSKKFTLYLLQQAFVEMRVEKKFGGNFTCEVCLGVNERIKVENPCFSGIV